MRSLVLIAASVLWFFLKSSQAAEIDVSAGASATVGVRWTPVVFVDADTRVCEWAGMHWQPTATIGWLRARHDETDHLDQDVWIAGAGVRLVDWWGGAFVGLEGAFADQRTDALSSHAEFISSLGWQSGHWILMVRHISNGNLFGGRNLGETMLLAGLGF